MRPFRIFKRTNGFYYARQINPETGEVICTRSTGVTDKFEALMIVSKWLDKGIPAIFQKRIERRQGIIEPQNITKSDKVIQLSSFDTISDEQALMLYQQLQVRLGLTAKVIGADVAKSSTEPPAVTGSKLKRDISGERLTDCLHDFWAPEKSEYITDRRDHGSPIGERHCYEMRNRIKTYWRPYFENTLISEIDSEDLREFFRYIKRELHLSGGDYAVLCDGAVDKKRQS